MSLAEKIAIRIGNNAKLFLKVDEDQEQVIVYGAINLFQVIFAFLWVIIAGVFFGVLYEALVFTATVGILRKYSGGAHASSSSRCIIIGTILAVLAGIIINNVLYIANNYIVLLISVAFMIFSFMIVAKNAPVDSIKKPINNIEMRKQFRKKSITVLSIYSIIIIILFILNKKYLELHYIKLMEIISLGVLWQTITLTKNGIRFLNKVDFVLKYITDRKG
ncbi:accessory gene regulator B family protein [Clostridium sp. YIM B02555]|uniref:accessory gene regulator ArgB-like protein n=1 Tax=Clostridium sp. YIM B02555 TaxID=2911968 RepID=UPI001EEE990D|nr:accessory gene regulator B family protein [Clostridium sp. YIM B02555]